jgi:hypothetical protein
MLDTHVILLAPNPVAASPLSAAKPAATVFQSLSFPRQARHISATSSARASNCF